MHPAAPMVARVLDADVPTAPGGPVLRAGSAAAVWLHAVHRDPAAWVRLPTCTRSAEAVRCFLLAAAADVPPTRAAHWLGGRSVAEAACLRVLQGPDADSFRPERWLSRSEVPDSAAAPSPSSSSLPGSSSPGGGAWALREDVGRGGAYMPFAAGPRVCIGQGMALFTLRVAIARLARAFEVAPAEGAGEGMLHPSVGFTVTPAFGVRLVCTEVALPGGGAGGDGGRAAGSDGNGGGGHQGAPGGHRTTRSK